MFPVGSYIFVYSTLYILLAILNSLCDLPIDPVAKRKQVVIRFREPFKGERFRQIFLDTFHHKLSACQSASA